MAAEFEMFDLWHLFVEVLFGHFSLAILGLVVIFGIICALFRMSSTLIFIIVGLFLFIMLTGFYGSIFAIIMSTFVFTYFMYSLIRWIQGWYIS